jgi:hypothetical protein
MTRMSYEAEPEEIDEVVLARARAVHAEVCGCDNKRCNLTNDVYQWLMVGDKGEGATTEALVEEWRAFNAGYPDGDPYERFYEVGDPTVLAAHMIRPYVAPQWLIEVHPNAEESDPDDLAAINASEWGTLEDHLQGWGEYTSVIHVLDTDTYYLARLA